MTAVESLHGYITGTIAINIYFRNVHCSWQMYIVVGLDLLQDGYVDTYTPHTTGVSIRATPPTSVLYTSMP